MWQRRDESARNQVHKNRIGVERRLARPVRNRGARSGGVRVGCAPRRGDRRVLGVVGVFKTTRKIYDISCVCTASSKSNQL